MSEIRRWNLPRAVSSAKRTTSPTARVAFIGSETKKKLFSGQTALGQNIRVDGITYKVVGVLEARIRKATTASTRMSTFRSAP